MEQEIYVCIFTQEEKYEVEKLKKGQVLGNYFYKKAISMKIQWQLKCIVINDTYNYYGVNAYEDKEMEEIDKAIEEFKAKESE